MADHPLLDLAMRSLVIFILLLLGAYALRAVVGAYRRRSVPPAVRAEVQAMILREIGGGPEALQWLRSSANPSALASNRFPSTAEAVGFVELLYDLGAVSVQVAGVRAELWREAEEGGAYADALVVVLPAAGEARQRLFEVAGEEARRRGLEAEPDWDQEQLILWWD